MEENVVKDKFYRNYYTTDALAEELGKTRQLISLLQKVGILHGIKLGRGFVFKKEDVDQFFDDYFGFELTNEDNMITAKAIVDSQKAATNENSEAGRRVIRNRKQFA